MHLEMAGSRLVERDVNEILNSTEKQGGLVRDFRYMFEFSCALGDTGLSDLGFFGYKLTWSKLRLGDANVQEFLDKFMENDQWKEFAEVFLVMHLPKCNPDHAPIVLA